MRGPALTPALSHGYVGEGGTRGVGGGGDVLDEDVDRHRFTGGGVDRALGGGGVAPVAAVADLDVVERGEDAVGGVEGLPTDVGDVELDPGVGGVGAGAAGGGVAGVDVAADVAGGDPEEASQGD